MTTHQVEIQRTINEELIPYDDTDDGKDHKAHIVNPPMNLHIYRRGMSPQDIVDTARLTGQEVVALCGYKWVPKRNPDKYDVCDVCMKIAEGIMREEGE